MSLVLVVLPIVWGFLRKQQGLPMFGSPTIAQLEDPSYRPGLVGMKKVDDGPVIDLDANDDQGTPGSDFAVTFTEGDPATLIEDPLDATVTDVDSATLASLTVTITNLLDTGFETLATDVTGTSIVANYAVAPGTGTLTLTGPDTLANFQTVLRKVMYLNTGTSPDATPRVIEFVANDGTTDGNTPSRSR